jgi:hypothetical protein
MEAVDKDGLRRTVEEAKAHLQDCGATDDDDDDDDDDVDDDKFIRKQSYMLPIPVAARS